MAKFGNENWKPIHVRDNFLFLKGSVKGFETQGSEEGVNAIAGPNSNPGSWPDGPAVIGIAAGYGAASQQGNIRAIDVEQLFNFAGSTSILSGKSVVGIRGCIAIAAPTTVIGSSYLFAVQGKIVVQGALANTGGNGIIATGILGQLDLSSALGLSSPIAAGWFDCGGSASSAAQSGSANIDGVVIYNTTAATINSMIRSICKANYLLDLSSNSGSPMLASKTAGGNAAKTLVINIDGTPYYIPLSASAT